MTTTDTSPSNVSAETQAAGPSPLSGLGSWLTSSDHKRIGRLWLAGGLLGTLAAAVFGLLIGLERSDPTATSVLLSEEVGIQAIQSFRVLVLLAGVLPLGIGLAVAVVPLQLGARALAFPRAAAMGFWAWLAGVIMVMVAIFNGGRIGGDDKDMLGLNLLGLAMVALGAMAAASTVATSVLTTRAPGMTMRRIPMLAWSSLISAIGLVVAMPVMIGAIIYLFVDIRYDIGTFGGSVGVGTWLGWALGQPLSFIFALPALGVFADLVPVTFRARQQLRGVMYAGLSLVGVAALAGATQQSMFSVPWSGPGLDLDDLGTKVNDLIPFAAFTLLPVLGVVIVLALGALTAKPTKGVSSRPRITAGFLFSFFGLGMILVGMLGTALRSIDDLGLQGTVFEEGALVYVAYGGVLGILGGVAHWAPKLWGRCLPESRVIPLALVGVLGTILASLPLYVAGFLEQPIAKVQFTISGPDALLNLLVLAGHGLMVLTLVGFVAVAFTSLTGSGEPPGDDPWEAHTIEWSTSSPAPGNNYPEVPVITSAEPMLDLRAATDGSPS